MSSRIPIGGINGPMRPVRNRAGQLSRKTMTSTRDLTARGMLSQIFSDESGDPDLLRAIDNEEDVIPQEWKTIDQFIGNTPLVRLQRLVPNKRTVVLAKLEGNNPASSVKDRPAFSLLEKAEASGRVKPGDTIIEATSGNTGIALAMACAIKGYKLKLIMPANMSEERKQSMTAYGAELIEVPAGKMEMARDLADQMQREGQGIVLDQFNNPDNPAAHIEGTGPEIWRDTQGRVTHFVSSMGTTGTITGTSTFLKRQNPNIQIIGLQPAQGAQIAGIRRWPKEYLPGIFDADRVDRVMDITQREAEETMRAMARTEGIFAGVSSGGAVSAALRLAAEVDNGVIVVIVCDRGDRYLSTGCFSAAAAALDPQPCPAEEFPSAAARMIAYKGPHYVVFTADPDPETGLPWCRDCARSIEGIRAAVQEVGGTLLEVHVGPRPIWKDPNHPFRTNPLLKVAGIPTLMRWDPSPDRDPMKKEGYKGPVARTGAELEKAATAEEAAKVAREFVQRTKDMC